MKYLSTRGSAPVLGFDDVLLTGLARDGGLYVPEEWPQFSADDIRALRGLSYAEVATRVMLPFIGDAIPEDDFAQMVEDTYAVFGHPGVAPLKQMGTDTWVMELFHGPTLAFKDYALQLVGRLFDYVLTKRGERITVVGATSGDTGSAAIEACRDRDAIECFILHPEGRVSEVQRHQMTTVLSPNVHNIAVQSTFDDCQDMVKAMFNDQDFRDRHNLSAVNSINWARVMAQIAYYFTSAVALGAPERSFTFAVPTGNFGNAFAAHGARRMGLPIDRLAIGSNANDILTRFFDSGTMTTKEVVPTISPSMDIQISSNFERVLFCYFHRDTKKIADAMTSFRETGNWDLDAETFKTMLETFEGFRLDDAGTKQAITKYFEATGEILDPHSAIGLAAGDNATRPEGSVLVAAATAHPAKFPDAVEEATGVRPALPARLADLLDREERYDTLPNDLDGVKAHIEAKLAERSAS